MAFVAWGAVPARSETVDRVVASVGRTAITASEVEQQYRLEFLLDGKAPSNAEPGSAALEQARERLIDRALLEEEVQANGIQVSVDDESVSRQLKGIRDKFAASGAFEDGLRAAALTEGDLRLHLARQIEILRLIDLRLRPEANVEPAEIETYYRETLVPELAKQGQPQPPALAEVEDRIREILVQEKINSLLEAWLRRLRAGREVKLYGSAEAESKT